MPGSPDPEPISVHVDLFKSIKSIICALSIMCLSFETFSDCLLIRLMTLFFSIIISRNFSRSGNVSRETFRGSKQE